LNPQNTSLNTVLGTFNATLANLETFKPRSKTHPWAVSRSLHKSTSCASLMDCVQLHEDVCVLRRTSVSTDENATGCSDRSHAGMLMTFVSRKQNNILITLATCRPDRTAGRPPVLTGELKEHVNDETFVDTKSVRDSGTLAPASPSLMKFLNRIQPL